MVKKNPMSVVGRPAGKPRKRTAAKRKPVRGRRGTKKTGRLRRWWEQKPRWVVWLVSGIVVAGYAVGLYFLFIRPYLYRWNAEDIVFYRPVVHGIDVSHYQGTIDWGKLREEKYKGEPFRFVFMKATEGSDLMDENYRQNMTDARRHGFLCGAYHFFSPLSPAEKQAAFFISQVKLVPGDLPPVLDVERCGSYGDDSLRMEVKNWLRVVEAHYGVKPILYASYKFKEYYLSDSLLNTYPYWIAHYRVDTLEYKGDWAFWQHRDDGRLNGIEGDVDLNVFNGSWEELLELRMKNEE